MNISVPCMYIGDVDFDWLVRKVHTCQSVINLYTNAREGFECLESTVEQATFIS
jgi:hypothetical protein